MDKKTNYRSGFSICDLLLVAFIILKLTGTINWSWWWVLAPLWIPLAIILICIIILGIFYLIENW